MITTAIPFLSVVVIGRNEGDKLVCCLESITHLNYPKDKIEIIYVDSHSLDQSVRHAESVRAKVFTVDSPPFSAARARNIGWKEAKGEYILFLDGDTVVNKDFPKQGLDQFVDAHIAIVAGDLREIDTKHSIYNRVLDLDWIYPYGFVAFCGGIFLIRKSILREVDGFDCHLIAGEEPDMCRRIRGIGYKILHIDCPMCLHDLEITTFREYIKRAFRSGYAYASVSGRYATTDDPFWNLETRNNFIKGGIFLSIILLSSISVLLGKFLIVLLFCTAFLVFLVIRTMIRYRWKTKNWKILLLYGIHSHFAKIPIFFGQLASLLDRYRAKDRSLIE